MNLHRKLKEVEANLKGTLDEVNHREVPITDEVCQRIDRLMAERDRLVALIRASR